MPATPDQMLSLPVLIEDLRRDGLLNDEEHQAALGLRRSPDDESLHALSLIARQGYRDARHHSRLLSEAVMMDWLARRHNLESVDH